MRSRSPHSNRKRIGLIGLFGISGAPVGRSDGVTDLPRATRFGVAGPGQPSWNSQAPPGNAGSCGHCWFTMVGE